MGMRQLADGSMLQKKETNPTAGSMLHMNKINGSMLHWNDNGLLFRPHRLLRSLGAMHYNETNGRWQHAARPTTFSCVIP